jgi:peptidoglycan/LPS O-acetylase OafA/YrhL
VRNPIAALNGALWSIPYEFWCYLAVLGAGVFGLLKRRLWLAIGFAIVIAAHVVFDASGKKPGFGYVGVIFGWPYLWSRMLPFFLAGTLVYLYRDRIPRSWPAAVGGVLALVLVAHFAPIACDVLQPIVIPYAALCVAFARGSLPVARFGDFSYGTYLYAFPVQQLLVATSWFAFPAYVAAAMVLSLAAGAASWHGVEKWFRVSSREPGSRANRTD